MQQTRAIGEKYEARLGRKGGPQGIMQEIKIWSYYLMVNGQTRICPWKWDAQNFLKFLDRNESLNPG